MVEGTRVEATAILTTQARDVRVWIKIMVVEMKRSEWNWDIFQRYGGLVLVDWIG